MHLESQFRKLFWVRIAIGFIAFVIIIYLIILFVFKDIKILSNPLFVVIFVLALFLIFASFEILKIFKLKVTDKGIEKILLVSGQRQFIPFEFIIGIKKERVRMRTKSGALTDGYIISILQLKNNKKLIVSPDNFENYRDLMIAINAGVKF